MRTLVFIISLCLGSQISFSQDVNIPDPNFLNAVIQLGLDFNGDGKIQLDEAEQLTDLNIANRDINDLTGINAFVNLNSINVEANKISDLSYLNLPALKSLNCSANNLAEINFNLVQGIDNLNCSGNEITVFDLSKLPMLSVLNCSNNTITSLDFTDHFSIRAIDCSFNDLSEITLVNIPMITDINVSNNNLTGLELTGLNIEDLWSFGNLDCSYNELTTLNLPELAIIYELDCSNNSLGDLDLDNVQEISFIDCSYNELATIDLSIELLMFLNCSHNKLTTLNLFGKTELYELDCSFNEIETIFLNDARDLVYLTCNNNKIQLLDVSNLDLIEFIFAAYNLINTYVSPIQGYITLTELDLRSNQFVEFNSVDSPLDIVDLNLSESPNLEVINIKDGYYISTLTAVDCPQLKYICTDDSEEYNVTSGNVETNSLCTSGPSAYQKQVSGKCYSDMNNEGCSDQLPGFANIDVLFYNPQDSFVVQTDANGDFETALYRIPYLVMPINLPSDDYRVEPFEFNLEASISEAIEFCIFPSPTFTLSSNFDLNGDGCDINTDSFPGLVFEIQSQNNGVDTLITDENGQASFNVFFDELLIVPTGINVDSFRVTPEQFEVNTLQPGYETEFEFCVRRHPMVSITNHLDLDNNGCDLNEAGLDEVKYIINDSSGEIVYTPDATGKLELLLDGSIYSIKPWAVDESLYEVSPEEFIINTNEADIALSYAFCIRPLPLVVLSNKIDVNDDGCESEEQGIGFVRFLVTNTSTTFSVFSDQDGNSDVMTVDDDYIITPVNIDNRLYSFSPAELFVSSSDQDLPDTLSFCLTRLPEVADLCVTTIPRNDFRPGFETRYDISYSNPGTDTKSGNILFKYEDEFMEYQYASNDPVNIEEGMLTFEFEDLEPNETRRISVFLLLNTPMDASPLEGGEILQASTWINPVVDDVNRTNNFFLLNREVVNSEDPNDKTCLQGNELLEEYIGEYVHYMIRFENTGTASAVNVVVRDTINLEDFDISTLEIIEASHQMETRIINPNIVEFVFDDIYLPFDDDNNDGYLVFKIKTLDDLVLGDQISNSAGIFFDFNFPIITNTEISEIVLPVSTKNVKPLAIKVEIAPNPVKNKLNFNVDKEIRHYDIFNPSGKLIMHQELGRGTHHTVNVEELTQGLYFLKLTGYEGVVTQRFIKI